VEIWFASGIPVTTVRSVFTTSSETVRARVTPSEYKAIAAKAGSEGVSDWARKVMLKSEA